MICYICNTDYHVRMIFLKEGWKPPKWKISQFGSFAERVLDTIPKLLMAYKEVALCWNCGDEQIRLVEGEYTDSAYDKKMLEIYGSIEPSIIDYIRVNESHN